MRLLPLPLLVTSFLHPLVSFSPSLASSSPSPPRPSSPRPNHLRHAFVYADGITVPGFRIVMASDKLMLSSEELAERKKDTNMLFLPVRATRGGRSPSAHSYLCQIPTSPSTAIAAHLFGDSEEAYQSRLSRSLAALKGLEKECITYSQGWWSYEFCHMSHVRQFHRPAHNPAAGSKSPAILHYILGRHPASSASPSHNSFSSAALVEFDDEGRNFLRFRWSDGTPCELTSQCRQIEIQFHCCATDHVSSVREMAVCNYVMIVHTSRVCDLPWFRGATENVPSQETSRATEIVCRPVVEPPYHAPTLVSASNPSFIPIIRKMKETESGDRSFDKPAASRLTDPPLVPKPDNAFPRNAPLEVADALYDDEYDPVQDLLDSVLQQQPLGGYDDYYDSEYDNDDAYIGRDLPLRQQQQQKEPNPSSHKRVPSEDGSRPSSTDDLDPLDERHWADEEYDFEDWANFHRYYRDNPDDEDEDAYDNKPKGSST
ncbi:hypothetical protein DFJ77DRAFT_463728 [Powellomyces hirtus]|nr:hypothetical protein DFJ77DRAFT_463728 [Powellomyces hirtus]